MTEPDEPDAEEKERLERWLDKAWKADCDITGQAPDGERDPNLIIENDLQNNTRKWFGLYLLQSVQMLSGRINHKVNHCPCHGAQGPAARPFLPSDISGSGKFPDHFPGNYFLSC